MRLTSRSPVTPTKDFDRLFEGLWGLPNWPAGRREVGATTWEPALDFSETPTDYIVRLEIPGVTRDDLDVSVDGNLLTLSGHRELHKREKGEDFLWEELVEGRFSRTLKLPGPYDGSKIDASYNDGILTVRIPKTELASKSKIQIR